MVMESYTIVFISVFLVFVLRFFLTLLYASPSSEIRNQKLPPGPPSYHLLAHFLWHGKPLTKLGPVISSILRHKYGPIITVKIGSEPPSLFIATNTLAHEALVKNATVVADRPKSTSIADLIFPYKRKGLSMYPFGTTWRVLRHNLTGSSGVLRSSAIQSIYSSLRGCMLEKLVLDLKQESYKCVDGGVSVYGHFEHAMFCLMVKMCFGDTVEEHEIGKLESAQKRLFLFAHQLKFVAILPNLGKILCRKRWKEFLGDIKSREDLFMGLIRERKKIKQENEERDIDCESYVDTLLDLRLPGDRKVLEEGEIVSLCDEFISHGSDTITTALHWIIANVVKYPRIQAKILDEIVNSESLKQGKACIDEDDLGKMPYLRAVVLEGLRRHPPVYMLDNPHAVTEDVQLGGYLAPKGISVNFMVADIGRDPSVWEHPLEFRPERFLNCDDDMTCSSSRDMKMMPFGAGRRMCPGLGLAKLQLEVTLATLIWQFEWSKSNNGDVDLTENVEFTTGMKNPLRARVSPRHH